MANYAVTTKIITHAKPNNAADTVANIDGDRDSLAKDISDYLETIDNSKTIHNISMSVFAGVAYVVIVHDS